MSTPQVYIEQAETLIAQGRLDEAVIAYEAALLLDSEHIDALVGAANLALSLNLAQECQQFAQEALRIQPGEPRATVIQGLLTEATEDVQTALPTFAQAAQAHPDSYAAQYHYGRALAVARRYPEAIETLQAASKLAPHNVAPHYALGIAYREHGQLGDAILALTQAIEVDSTYLDGYVTLVDLLTEAGQTDQALEVLDQAQTLEPELPMLLDKRAAVHLKAGDLAGAIDALKQQAQLDPDDITALSNLATFALSAGDADSFANAVEMMLEHHPQHWQSHHMHALLLDMADQPEEALEALRRAHQLAPQEWKPLNDLGDLLNAKAQSQPDAADEAVDVLTAACQLAPPEELTPRYNLALAYWNAGHRERARDAAAALVQHGPPNHPLVAQTQEVLDAMQNELNQPNA